MQHIKNLYRITGIKRFISYLLPLFIFAVVLSGCEGSGFGIDENGNPITGSGGGATLTNIKANILPVCSCHRQDPPAGGMSLTDANVYSNWVGVAATGYAGNRVEPGDSANSIVYLKISGSTMGAQMPLGLAPLSASQIQTIADWIDAGALDD